uniref:Uncharacterized protein n=1 Tax=Rhizophora mucronata TaxID=61149 RepID=A0A2P2NEJ9_RHIMU
MSSDSVVLRFISLLNPIGQNVFLLKKKIKGKKKEKSLMKNVW